MSILLIIHHVTGAVNDWAAGWADTASLLPQETHTKCTKAVRRFDAWYTSLGIVINDMAGMDDVLCDY